MTTFSNPSQLLPLGKLSLVFSPKPRLLYVFYHISRVSLYIVSCFRILEQQSQRDKIKNENRMSPCVHVLTFVLNIYC
jgi:hypothetical protein